MNEKYDILDKENATELGRVDGSITIENVSFQYDEEEMHVLNNVNLNVEKGETIALVGMSGGGKSTLISLIDRKSTRLNSSHVAISYAVFCLKKKIKDGNKNID